MRIPFPSRITPWHAATFAALLCVFELVMGTAPFFVLCVFLYIIMATAAFNLADGLNSASGGYILSAAVLGLVLSQCAKVFVWEPADSNLRSPLTTIAVYTAGMAGVLLATILSRRYLPRVALFEKDEARNDTRQIGIGCIVMGIALPSLIGLVGGGSEGSLGSALNLFQNFLPLGMLLLTYAEVRNSGGRKSVNPYFLVGAIYLFVWGGFLGTSKQAMFTPPMCYLLACAATRFKFKPVHMAVLGMVGYLLFAVFVPFSQVVRNFSRGDYTVTERFNIGVYWLENMTELKEIYRESNEAVTLNANHPRYYNSSDMAFMERLGMLPMDDALITQTDTNGAYGYFPMLAAIENLVPHAIFPNKPPLAYGNTYAHEIGIISEDDLGTSVAFGAFSDAYKEGKWFGVLVLTPLLFAIMFFAVDAIAGSIRTSPWPLIYTIYFLHAGPEGSLYNCITIVGNVTPILIVTVYAARYVMPILGSFVFPEQRKMKQFRKVRSFARTAPGLPPPMQPETTEGS